MSVFMKRMLMALCGALAGCMAWPLLLVAQSARTLASSYLLFTLLQGAAFGAVFGAVFGAFEGIAVSSRRKSLRGLLFGGAFGLVSGALGMLAGQGSLLLVGNLVFRTRSGLLDAGMALATGLGWMLTALAITLVEGLRARSGRKLLIGLAGGLLGGLCGGSLMQLAARLFPGNSLALLGALVLFGLVLAAFYSLFENRLSAGTLKLLNGPVKGKEYQLTRARTLVGSDQACDIVLSGYPEVLPRHALIRLRGKRLSVETLSGEAMLKVNDEVVRESSLRRDDVLAIGKAKLFFGFLALALTLFAGGQHPLAAQTAASVHGSAEDSRLGSEAGMLRITQVDTARLLSSQTVRLFVDTSALPGTLAPDYFSVEESSDGVAYQAVPVKAIRSGTARDEGISYFFLLDNSGSMWDDLEGRPTDSDGTRRVRHATAAVRDFLALLSPRDRVGLAVFNSDYELVQECDTSIGPITSAMESLARPESAQAYTELYNSVGRAIESFGETGRRRVLIVLSDGENWSVRQRTGESGPVFGSAELTPADVLALAEREGISLYSVRLGPDKDTAIGELAKKTGGRVFDAGDRADMAMVYGEIRRQVLEEISISYRAAMLAGSERHVRLTYLPPDSGLPPLKTDQRYFAGNLLGGDMGGPSWYHLAFLLVPAALIALFIVFKVERESSGAALELVSGYKAAPTRIFKLGHEQTVIGGSSSATLTIAGNPSLRDEHATILFDPASGGYTLAGNGEVTVNNRPVTRRRLESGDVINMAGTIVVFDDKLVKPGAPLASRPKPPASRG